jgi:hypothetical protein
MCEVTPGNNFMIFNLLFVRSQNNRTKQNKHLHVSYTKDDARLVKNEYNVDMMKRVYLYIVEGVNYVFSNKNCN